MGGDVLTGGEGDDILTSGTGSDHLIGGFGSDHVGDENLDLMAEYGANDANMPPLSGIFLAGLRASVRGASNVSLTDRSRDEHASNAGPCGPAFVVDDG